MCSCGFCYLSGVTNLLNNCMNKAKEGDLKFKLEIDEIFKKHIDIINLFFSKKVEMN